jgi:hypothetical protein
MGHGATPLFEVDPDRICCALFSTSPFHWGKTLFFVEKQGSIPKKSANLRFHRNHMGMMCVENVYSIQVDSNSTVFAATTSPAFNKDLSAREVEG